MFQLEKKHSTSCPLEVFSNLHTINQVVGSHAPDGGGGVTVGGDATIVGGGGAMVGTL